MADLAPNNTLLGINTPKIFIIPPSPRKGSSTGENVTEPSPAIYYEDDSQQNGDNFKAPANNSSEKQSDEVKDVGTSVPEEPKEGEKNEEDDAVFTNIKEETRFERCWKTLVSFNESKYMLIFQFLQIGVPILAGLLGADFLSKCALSSEMPFFLLVMITTGGIVVFSHLLLAQKMTLTTRKEYEALRVAIIACNGAIAVYMVTELFSFSQTDPSFEIGSEEYCLDLFYKYTIWTACFCIVIVSFLVLLLLPKRSSETSQREETK